MEVDGGGMFHGEAEGVGDGAEVARALGERGGMVAAEEQVPGGG